MFPQAVLWGTTCLGNVHLGTGSARDPVDHSCPAVGLSSILQVHKPSSEGLVGAETGADAQGREGPMY